jgi:hypothetical protein
MDFPKYLNFLLQFCPEVPGETALRAKYLWSEFVFSWNDLLNQNPFADWVLIFQIALDHG